MNEILGQHDLRWYRKMDTNLRAVRLLRGGVAQLILSDPQIVIFNEATSALDNTIKFHLNETLAPFFKECKTIIIAHRTTIIRQANYLYFIEACRVSVKGSYGELQEK